MKSENSRHRRVCYFATPPQSLILSRSFLREIGTSYRQVAGGITFGWLERVWDRPSDGHLFQSGFGPPPIASIFALFYATVCCFFNVGLTSAIRLRRPLIIQTVTRHPRVTFIDANLGRLFLNFPNAASCGIYRLAGVILAL